MTRQSPFLPTETPPPTREVYSVSRLNREAKALLEDNFLSLWVEGEISNLARPASGHLYFSLKDAHAQIRCALFRGQQRGMACVPKDGMQVLVRAHASLYEGRGEFQLIVDSMEEAGEGALRRAFELLKNRLAQEGLFQAAHKKPLPRLARRLGVITSPTGAAIRDILTTLKRRFPSIHVILYPVPVQGEGAAEKIVAALKLAGERADCDALIVARGGGSLEDLWCFNEEMVARAIYACPIPVVTGVGHEIDFTIADLVADARAATPTAAAEMLSPNQTEWLAAFSAHQTQLIRLLRKRLLDLQQRLDWLTSRLIHPQERIARLHTRLGELSKRLHLAQLHIRRDAQHRLQNQSARLLQYHPGVRLREVQLRLEHTGKRLLRGWKQNLAVRQQRLQLAGSRLDALSPLATLARGYAIVQHAQDNRVVHRANALRIGEQVKVRVAQGSFRAKVEDTET